jgi:hypothetical protein
LRAARHFNKSERQAEAALGGLLDLDELAHNLRADPSPAILETQ